MTPIIKPFIFFLTLHFAIGKPTCQSGKIPQAIEIFYKDILPNPGTKGQNLTLIREAFADDFNVRPNFINPAKGLESGFFPEGVKQFMDIYSVIFSGIKVDRIITLVCGDKVVVLNKLRASINEAFPPGLTELPMFPSISVDKLKGKSFETIIMDLHVFDNGKIRRSWHFEDWSTALDEILTDRLPANVDHELIPPGEFLSEIPMSINNFYDRILSDGAVGGQNKTLLSETIHDDWNVRPNPLNIEEGTGPGINGLAGIAGLFATIMPDMRFDRRLNLLNCDKVVVLCKISGTITNALPGASELPMFPGIPVEKLIGKKFESMALDIQTIVDGKIKQSYHIEDWVTGLQQLLNGTPAPDFGFDQDYLDFDGITGRKITAYENSQKVPKAIENFYDRIISNPGTSGQDIGLLRETFAEDFNTRPNPLNPSKGIESGPFPEGFKTLLASYAVMMPDINFQRLQTLILGDKVVVLTKFSATMNAPLPDFTEFPMFPGISDGKLKGKSFESMAIDIHLLDDGFIRRTWHLEDWTTALDEMLTGRQSVNLDQPSIPTGRLLTEVPQSIYNFYDKILSDVTNSGQNLTLLSETVHEDWQSRPNALNVVEGTGPGINGLAGFAGLFATIMPDLKFERKQTLINFDKVVVLSLVSGTVTNPLPGQSELPLFPGIPVESLIGKRFETLALDIQTIVDGKIKQSFHVEDWATALNQMLNDTPPPDFGLDRNYTDF